MKKNNKRGLNATIKAVIAKNPNMNPAEFDKAMREVAKQYGMTWKELTDWIIERVY